MHVGENDVGLDCLAFSFVKVQRETENSNRIDTK